MTERLDLPADDFIPHVECWYCQDDLDALPWTAELIGGDLHPVCPTCRKERLS